MSLRFICNFIISSNFCKIKKKLKYVIQQSINLFKIRDNLESKMGERETEAKNTK